MKAKICGITNIEDALLSIKNGAWAVGFNFYTKSPRYISFKKAKEIVLKLPTHIIKVGIFINYSKDEILNILEFLDFIQIYSQDLISYFNKKKFILALQADSQIELPKYSVLQKYEFILLDAPKQQDGLLGGTGRLANWALAKKLAKDYKLILAGGLDNINIEKAVKYVHPFAVDAVTKIEQYPGKKNPLALREFLTRCKNVN